MITAERLEELIKQGGLIYAIWFFNHEIEAVNIGKHKRWEVYDGRLYSYYLNGQDDEEYDCNDLFETLEQAEWALETKTARIERFEPPMWEDIEVVYTFDFITKGLHLRFAMDKHLDVIVVYKLFNGLEKDSTIFDEHATKENYIKACEIVRDLFNKGGAK